MSIRQRVLVGAVAVLGVGGSSLGLYLAQAPEHRAGEVVVDDTAEILDEARLSAAVDDLRFHEPTDVAVLTHRGGPEALSDDLALNDAVLEHARTTRTEWLSADEQRWADDLFVFAVDPEGRLVGTYFGDNRAVGNDAQLAIQDTAKEDFRAGRWTEGVITGVEAGADRMNAPLIRRTGGVVAASAVSAATLLGAGGWLGVGMHRAGRSRRARAEGDERMAAVVRDTEVTELHARLIPEDSRYGGLMLRRYDDYTTGVRELTELGNEARSVRERDYDARDALRRLTAYRDKAVAVDQLDDVIADTAAFLNRDRAWVEAWQRQVAPVREDLEKVEPLLAEDLPVEARGVPEAQELREFASAELVSLDRLRGDLERRAVSPDDALDHLRTVRDRLSGHLDDLAAAVAQVVGEDESERTMLGTAMGEQRSRRVAEPTIISTAHPAWTWYAVDSFRTGLSSGTSEVQQSRSSSSGGSSGYSGGGGFSGAGSSSRF